MLVVVAATGEGPPSREGLASGLAAGVCGIAALMCFYRALAIGTMSIVAPVASTGVALPVLVGLATGDQPSVLRSVGLAAAVVGVVLASRTSDAGTEEPPLQRQSIVLAVGAGLGFGMYFLFSEISSREDVGWALLLSRIGATPFAVAFALVALRRGGRGLRGREIAIVAVIGLLDLGANALLQRLDDDRRAVDGLGRELAVPRDDRAAGRGAARRAGARRAADGRRDRPVRGRADRGRDVVSRGRGGR